MNSEVAMVDHARRAARDILDRQDFGMPVDVEAVANSLNIHIRRQDLEDNVSGLLVIKKEAVVIGVNSKHHPHRQRFTIAHELGHYELHRTSAHLFVDAAPVFFRNEESAKGNESQEIEANAFAAELLMPADVLRTLVTQPLDVFDDAAVRQLAAHFGVSAQAITIQLTKLALISV